MSINTFDYTEYDKATNWPNDPDHGDEREVYRSKPASNAAVTDCLKAEIDDSDGRSPWMWFRTITGDLILGFYPCGNLYDEHEREASF